MSNNDKMLVEINSSLQDYLRKGYHVPGSTMITEKADFMRPSIRIVQIDPKKESNEVYPVSGGKFGLGRPAIQKFVNAGRIELKLPPNATTVERGRGVARYTAKVIGERFELDGSPKRIEDAKTLDLVIREEEIRMKYEAKADTEHPNWPPEKKKEYVERCAKKVIIEKHKFAEESAITGAQARVVQKLLGLKPVYTLEELKKPFIIVSVTPVVDMNDPDIKRMVTAHMLGIKETLYPHASGPSSHVPRAIEAIDVDVDADDIPADIYEEENSRDGFEDYPRPVKESIIRIIIKDNTASENLGDMAEKELIDLYQKLKAA